jgi:hypothetical protein
VPACRKTGVEQLPPAANIQISEIVEWAKWYSKSLPKAPKMLLAQAEKTLYKDRRRKLGYFY